MALKYKAQPLFDDYVSHYDTLADYSGLTFDIIDAAIEKGELLPIHGNKFRHVDLASWMEQRRYLETPETASDWLKRFNYKGIESTDFSASDEIVQTLWNFLENQLTTDNPINAYTLRDVNGVFHRERFLRQFNFPVLDEIIFNWTEVHELTREVMQDQPYVVEQLSFIAKPPLVNPTPPHVDIEWVASSRRLPIIVIGVNLTEKGVGDGGVMFLPSTHRSKKGRMNELPKTLDGFQFNNQELGGMNVHNAGVIHATPPHVLNSGIRKTFYITMCGWEDCRNWNRMREDNQHYVFNI